MPFLLTRILDFIAFRTTKRYNVIKIRSLRPNYYDKDTLLLHAIMQLVVDYVEIELASLNDVSYQPKLKKAYSLLPWFIRPDVRDPKAGLKYIEHAEKCLDKDDQWITFYRSLRDVYHWWKNVYPKRKSPEEVFGYAKFLENSKKYSKTYALKKQNRIFQRILELEAEYLEEESRMMKFVIDNRSFLWT